RAVISGLPDPATLPTPARWYIAWATTPLFDRWQRIGVVGNGVTTLDVVAWDQFVIVISAEQDSTVAERSGPVMLRGGGPSTRMQPPDFLEVATGMIGLSADAIDLVEQGHAHHAHDAGRGAGPEPDRLGVPPRDA